MKKISLISVLFLLLIGSGAHVAATTSGSSWQAGNIIDDAAFTDKNSMSVAQIQSFLNNSVGTGPTGAKAGACDTYGSAISEWGGGTRANYGSSNGNPAPFTCLKDYYEVPKLTPGPDMPQNNYGGKVIPPGAISAAQMIYNAAQKYSISPKVLLVMIQKESAGPLTQDDWPFQKQFTYAMGAHCPDSGPGGSANCDPNYAGFSIQISESASLLRWYLDNSTQSWWPYNKPFQNNSILWNVAPSNCGSGVVYTQNRATAALYTYTPYQPNKAALDNMYGTGDQCSAYGNRNFWRIYNDWFGSPYYQLGTTAANKSAYSRAACTIPSYNTDKVGRLYNPDTQDYLFTNSRAEACGAIRLGYIWDQVTFSSVDPAVSDAQPVRRLRLGSYHAYTTNTSDFNTMVSSGYIDEGIIMYGFNLPGPNRLPSYMLGYYDNRAMTSAGGEGTYFVNSLGYKSFGIGFYTPSMTSPAEVLRLRNKFDRFYTTSQQEASAAIDSYGYSAETSALNVDSNAGQYSLPVYRLHKAGFGHVYTADRRERDLAVVNYGYMSEGIGFYSYVSNLPGVQLIYRSSNYTTGLRLYTQYPWESDNSQTYYGYTKEGISWYAIP